MAQHETSLEEQYVQFPMRAFTALPELSEAELKVLLYVTRQIKNYPGVTRRMLSTDEIQHGRKRQDGSRMDRGTGLSNRAVIDAIRLLAHRKYLFPAAESGGQKSYAITDCPPLTDGSPMKKVHRHKQHQEEQGHASMNNFHSTYEESSQGDVKKVHSSREDFSQEATDGASLQAARRVPTDTLGDTYSTDTRRDTRAPAARSPIGSPSDRSGSKREDEPTSVDVAHTESDSPLQEETAESKAVDITAQDLDALQQRQVAEHALQKLLAEQEQLSALLPSQRGWGAAQGRLRAVARDIARLQVEAAVQAPAASPAEPEAAGEAEPSAARRSPAQRLPQRANAPTEPAQDTRWQRLMQLQGELAPLKKSPSMQLLARQRIPKLEAEIKQLITELQESA